MENQKSFLDKIIEKIDFLGNVECEKINIEKEDKKDIKKEEVNYISQNIYILSPN
jgi:hypothetical protein